MQREKGVKMKTFNIAIDGPAGAGKSTVARRVAKELSFVYVDTGAMYRAIGLFMIQKDVDVSDEPQVEDALKKVHISIAYDHGEQQVLLNGQNVSTMIREEKVGNMASRVSAISSVREKLLDLQKNLASEHDVVMDGRDIGTHILPMAQLKIYLTASADTRAKRRFDELTAKGTNCDLCEIKADIEKRDEQDMNRAIAPLRQAEDAVYLDSSDMTIDQVTSKIVTLAKERSK